MQQQPQVDEPIMLKLKSPKLNKLYFVCSINSKEGFTDPGQLQIDFITNKAEVILALKIPKTVALISLVGTKANHKCQFNELNPLFAFKLIDIDTILAGYGDGRVILKSLATQKMLKEFNVVHNQIYINRRVLKLHVFQQNYLILFMDGYMMLVDSEWNTIYPYDFEKIQRLSFIEHKRIVQNKILKHIQSEGIEYDFLNYQEFSNFQIRQEKLNPQRIYRFECTSINEIEILPFSPLEHLKKTMEQGLCVAYSGYDGYFRLIDILNNKPLFSFKSEFAGICSFAFNPNYQWVCLGCQDDSSYVISFHNQIKWIKLVGHNSFISRGVFSSISATEFRVICTSYDGTMSITDIDTNEMNMEESLFVKAIPKKTLSVNNMQVIHQDGIAYVAEYQNYVVTINYDGSIRIFLLQ